MDQNHDLAAYMASVPGYQYAADSHGYYDPHRLGGFSRLDTRNGSKNRPFVFDEDLRLRFPIDTSPNQNAYHCTTPSNYSEYASMQLSSDLMSLVCTEVSRSIQSWAIKPCCPSLTLEWRSLKLSQYQLAFKDLLGDGPFIGRC